MASTYLNRNASATATTFTFSGWLKRSSLSSDFQYFFTYQSSGGGSTAYGLAFNDTTDKMYYYGTGGAIATDAVFRDTAAWYHVVLSVSSGTGTLYVNNETVKSSISVEQVTSGEGMTIGAYKYGSTIDYEFDGYMSELHFTDGTAYAPTTFGETDTTGVWVPKVGPTVTYGTNGFYLKFENSGAMGTDSSGNSNTFALGGGTLRQVPDTPTNVFPTLNPLVAVSPIPTLSEGNLESTPSGNGNHTTGATQTMPENSGKWYAETVLTYVSEQSGAFTIQDPNNIKDSIASYSGQYSVIWQASGTDYYATHDGSSATNSTNATISVGDIFQIAYDSDNGKVWFGRNNTWITGNPSTDTTPTYSSITGDKVFTTTGYRVSSGSSYTAQLVNFGQDSSFGGNKTAQNNADANGKGDFYYAPPTGFLALCTDNLSSELTIPVNDGSSAFHTQLYTGNRQSTQTITNDANAGDFQPDWVWIKQRNDTVAHAHNLIDAVRGATKTMYSNSTDSEQTVSNGLTSFNTDGFSIGNNPAVNQPDRDVNYVAWQWKASNTTASNTDGTITSTVSANTTAGFSIVTYTGNRTAGATVGHGLGVAPSMVIAKCRTASAGWPVFHASLGGSNFVRLNDTSASASNSVMWNNTTPSSTVVTLGGGDETNNDTGGSVMYCFAEIEGYSKIGSYTGNGSTNGTFVYTGFRPAWLLVKDSSAGENWMMYDNKRDPFNEVDANIKANSGNAETDFDVMDFVSNGFKIRQSSGDTNNNGNTYIFMAFAENPFVTSTGKPVTAR